MEGFTLEIVSRMLCETLSHQHNDEIMKSFPQFPHKKRLVVFVSEGKINFLFAKKFQWENIY
jgi:hypothetical protein